MPIFKYITQKGFTLIELMIVIAIIAILAASAVPAYIDHLKKPKVAEGVNLLSGLKTPTEEWFGSKGTWPSTIDSIGGKTSGRYTTAMGVDGMGYSASFKDPAITGILLLEYDSTHKVWTCTHEGMYVAYLPSNCK